MTASPARPIFTRVVVAVLLVGAFCILCDTVLGFTAYRDATYLDSATIMRVLDVLRDGHVYPDSIFRPPYYVTLYGPLMYLTFTLPVRLAQAFGGDISIALRLTVFTFYCATLLLVFLITGKISSSTPSAWLSVAFALSSHLIGHWTTEIRSDFLALACSLLAFYLFLQLKHQRGSFLSAIPAGLALLMKQTFVGAPIAIVAWLLYRRRFKEALYWAATLLLVAGGAYSLVWLREPLMGQHLAALRNPIIEIHGAIFFITEALMQPMTAFAAVGAFLLFIKRSPEDLLLAFYWLAAWFIACGTILQAGGDINYFFESMYLSSIFAGPVLAELQRRMSETPAVARILTCVLLLALFATGLHEDLWALQKDYGDVKKYRSGRAGFQALTALIKGHRFLSTYPDLTILSKLPELPDPLLNTFLEAAGRWSYQPVIDQLDGRIFEFVIILPNMQDGYRGFRLFDDGMMKALQANYNLSCTFQGMQVWFPEGDPSGMLSKFRAIGCDPPKLSASGDASTIARRQ